MTQRSRSIAAGLLGLSLIGWIALITWTATRPDAPHTVPRAVALGALITTTLAAAGWLGILYSIRVIREALSASHGRVDRRLDALSNGQVEHNARAEQDTADLRFLISAPPVRATAPIPVTVGAREKSRRRRRSRSQPSGPPVGDSALVDRELRAYMAGLAERELRRGEDNEAG